MSSLSLPVHRRVPTIFFVLLLISFPPTCFSLKENIRNQVDSSLFAWARQHGIFISESIQIRSTTYGGRGLFAIKDIPANTELIRVPYDLQLGVRQLAESTDDELQAFARALPWEFLLKQNLQFLPLSIALCAEQRKGTKSIFEPYLRELTLSTTHALCNTDCMSFSPHEKDKHNNDLTGLELWDPTLARKIRNRRQDISAMHYHLAPSSLSFQDLLWAITNVCSRSLVRSRKPELSNEQTKLIGEFAASDRSRMLPVIDLVNHGSLCKANVWVGHGNNNSNEEEDYSTSLKSARDIQAGEELLFDYGVGDGQQISNQRLLLDYGFVLPDHNDKATLSLDEFLTVLSTLDDARMGMQHVPKEDIEALIQFLIRHASEIQMGDPFVFEPSNKGDPSTPTLALAVVMTCRGQGDVTRVLQPVLANPKDASSLVMQILESATAKQIDFARKALRDAAAMALNKRTLAENDNTDDACASDEKSFAKVAREYAAMCRATLQKAAEATV